MRARKYTDDFKADALAMIRRKDRSFRELEQALGVSHWTLRDWYKSDEMARKKGKRPKESALVVQPAAETPEQKLERLERENSRLRKQVVRLEEERAILKKAAAFFAKESE
jgi:transposase